jgi:glycine hydroxymethyltransferase
MKNFYKRLCFGFSHKFKPAFFKDTSLEIKDPELFELIRKEEERQWVGLELIASENYTSSSVYRALGSVLSNKYSEGQPGQRYYGGNEIIDKIEILAKQRTLKAFGLNPTDWHCNVQALSGSPANFSVYTAVLKPGEKMLGLHLYSGGHLTHGFQTADKKISGSSYFFNSDFYHVDSKTGIIDYEGMAQKVKEFQPKIIICGGSAYTRDIDYKKFREAADSVGAYLMADIAHISGLIAAKEHNDPFEYCDIVTSTTHKTLRGPRSGIILCNIKKHPDLKDRIDFAVFPMLHGGPHNHQIAGVCNQMLEVASPEFKRYAIQVKANANALAKALIENGEVLIGNGTENHLMLWDVRPKSLNGQLLEKGLELIHVTVNKNTIIGDKNALKPGGVRLGTPAITTRGMNEKDMQYIAKYLTRFAKIAQEHVVDHKKTLLKTFLPALREDQRITDLSNEVKEFCKHYEVPGVTDYNF